MGPPDRDALEVGAENVLRFATVEQIWMNFMISPTVPGQVVFNRAPTSIKTIFWVSSRFFD